MTVFKGGRGRITSLSQIKPIVRHGGALVRSGSLTGVPDNPDYLDTEEGESRITEEGEPRITE